MADEDEYLYDQDYRPPRWRERLMPKSVLGITAIILSAAVGAAFSGTVLYAYYDYRLEQNETRIETFTEGFDERFKTATDVIKAEREQAKAEVRKELEPIKAIRAEGQTLEDLVKKVGPSAWHVTTLDEAGQPSVGTAFVVASDNDQSLLVTSFATIRANTRAPAPPGGIVLRKGDEQVKGTLHTWQEEKDLALLVMAKGKQPKLEFAPTAPPLKIGQRIFAISGLGASGASAVQGFVSDVSSSGLQHDTPIGMSFQGSPLVNDKGEVLAIASRAYAPLGFATEGVFFAPPVRAACEKVLKCPDGAAPAAGPKG